MTVGRPTEFDPDLALDAAMRLFWRKGYESTSLQDLLTTMDLSKSSFYQTFGNKHQLFEDCLLQYKRDLVSIMEQLLEESDSGREFIKQILFNISNETRGPDARRGCLVMNSASEFSQRDPVIADLIKESIDAFRNVFLQAILEAQQDGTIAKDKDAQALSRYLLSSMSGLKTMVKAGASAHTIQDISSVVLSALD